MHLNVYTATRISPSRHTIAENIYVICWATTTIVKSFARTINLDPANPSAADEHRLLNRNNALCYVELNHINRHTAYTQHLDRETRQHGKYPSVEQCCGSRGDHTYVHRTIRLGGGICMILIFDSNLCVWCETTVDRDLALCYIWGCFNLFTRMENVIKIKKKNNLRTMLNFTLSDT